MEHVLDSMRFEEIILNSLNFLQKKLTNNTFTNMDIHVLMVLKKHILNMKDKNNKRQQKERTVYWLTRQGR